jgi:co-chaperonin GroES (HSP10)
VDDPKPERVGGIYLPETVEPEPMVNGTVISVSRGTNKNGVTLEPEVKCGDRVVYTEHAGAGNIFQYDKMFYRIVKATELMAVVL